MFWLSNNHENFIHYDNTPLESQQQQVVRVEAEQMNVYADSPSQATASPVKAQQLLQVDLSAANYKTRMRTRMNLEMKQIEQRLSTNVEQ